jgi:hypothetical protein
MFLYDALTAIPLCETKDIDSSQNRHDILGNNFPDEYQAERPIEYL